MSKSDKVRLKMSFEELFGKDHTEISPRERKQRWLKWLKLAKAAGHTDLVEYWSDTECCEGCIFFQDDFWCWNYELPATVNPLLSFRTGMNGMACMGFGKEVHEQLDIFQT